MDPASAFALACGVIQVVQASFGLLSLAKELYRKGSIDSIEHLKEQISHFESLLSLMNARRRESQLGENDEDKQDFDDLEALAKVCNNSARRLVGELRDLSVSEPHKFFEALTVSAKSAMKSSKIQKLKDEMKGYQEVLNTRILVALWTKLHHSSIEQQEGLKRLDGSLQAVADVFSERLQSFQSLQLLLSVEGRLNVDQILQQQEKERTAQRFLDSLKFSDLIHGQKKIVDAHEKTYQWIFDESGQKLGEWSNFVDWLKYGHGTYWIIGKAGSGKSTLMNFIWQNEQTMDHLRVWAGIKSLTTPLFFFSATGTHLQQSVEGLLRSLICQIFEGHKQTILTLLQENPTLTQGAQVFPVWTEMNLRHLFLRLIKTITPAYRICIFIDGLDECSGDHRELLQIICQFANNEDVKVCFSSRPERPFEEFSPSCSLRLQDLTMEDMRIYVETKLDEIPQMQTLSSDKIKWKDKVRQLIVERAQGVFLWVELATKSQINGIRNFDDLVTLERKLSSLPGDVEELYSRMLAKMDGYELEAAQYLHLAHHFTRSVFGWTILESHVLNFAIARFGLKPSLRLSSKMNRQNLSSKCVEVSQRIPITCVGFLELYDKKQDPEFLQRLNENDLWLAWEPPETRSTSLDVDWRSQGVRFIHRSAKDYFEREAKGGRFLDCYVKRLDTENLLGSALHLVRMNLCNLRDQRAIEEYMLYHVACLMDIARYANTSTSSQISRCVDLLEYFDDFANKLYRDDPRFAGAQHWSQRWLLPYLQRRKGVLVDDHRQVEAAFPCRYAPTELRSSAALWKVDWYLHGNGETESMTAEKATQLAMGTATHCGAMEGSNHVNCWYLERTILRFADIETLMSLIGQGANPNIGILTSFREQILYRLYETRLGLRHFNDKNSVTDESIAGIFQRLTGARERRNRTCLVRPCIFQSRFQNLTIYADIEALSLPIIKTCEKRGLESNDDVEMSGLRSFNSFKKSPQLYFCILIDSVEKALPADMVNDHLIDDDGDQANKGQYAHSTEAGSENESEDESELERKVSSLQTNIMTTPLSGMRCMWNTKAMTKPEVDELHQMLRELLDLPKQPKYACRKWLDQRRPLVDWCKRIHEASFPEHHQPEVWYDEIDESEEEGTEESEEEDTEESDYDG